MKRNSVIIIGAGLGGLTCGYILAKNGLKVTLLEQDSKIGGCLQTFRRNNTLFDTGFHYVDSLKEGESLHTLFSYFDLMSLPWKQLDETCFDEVILGDKVFPFANGHSNFVETLSAYFPSEKENLKRYIVFLKQVGDQIFDVFKKNKDDGLFRKSLFAYSAYDFLKETIKNPLLRQVLSGTSLKMELNATTLPLYTFAQINDSFIRSAWRLRGGGAQIAEKFVDSIRLMGGEIRTEAKVSCILEEEGIIKGVQINEEDYLRADYYISSLHPSYTISLVGESQKMRRSYRNRITHLDNTFGMFTANIRLKSEGIPYLNRNLFVHEENADLWNIRSNSTDSVLVHFGVPDGDVDRTTCVDLLSPMNWEEVKIWKNRPIGRRGEDYVSLKERKTEACLNLVEKHLPELRGAIERIYTSTPLTYNNYIASVEGTAYGIRKDYNNPQLTVFSTRTPIPNLLLTGQSLNLHGVLGVSLTSLFTCSEIIGMNKIRDIINNN